MTTSSDTLHACAHCAGTGTCKAMPTGESCAACIKRNELKKGSYIGLACGTCGGLGITDTYTYRITHRTQPLLSIVLVVSALFLVVFFGIFRSEYFHEVLAFCTTLIGSVTGFYFSSRVSPTGKP